jgi:uncharacterized protein YutE (UPF0331/DUF86 family)
LWPTQNPSSGRIISEKGIRVAFDLGRHILAKGYAVAPVEYREISSGLVDRGVLFEEEGKLLRNMAGYRNRMVHFYHEIGLEELYQICQNDLSDIEKICDTLLKWLRDHPDKVDTSL